ncbi:hypothetical protein HZH68_013510 [Vespula germanica]|uniref:Uncharacterized protein n=1 Tax=Vespula germanica TaxID=30212 RepID=A0A834JDU8_VESGE|nr:hypothetical protein HZH68_013510 [Vespula germanica]
MAGGDEDERSKVIRPRSARKSDMPEFRAGSAPAGCLLETPTASSVGLSEVSTPMNPKKTFAQTRLGSEASDDHPITALEPRRNSNFTLLLARIISVGFNTIQKLTSEPQRSNVHGDRSVLNRTTTTTTTT